MSEREAQKPPNRSTREDGSSGRHVQAIDADSPPPSRELRLQHTASAWELRSPTSRRSEQNASYPVELPPISRLGGHIGTSSTRIAGVSSILNPTPADDSTTGRRRKVVHLESPASSVQSLPPIISSVSRLPGAPTPYPPLNPASQYSQLADRPPRRILTPRSPSLHRAASLAQLQPSTSNISAQHMPHPSSPRTRPYTAEPGTSSVPPLPTPPAGSRSLGYGFPTPPPPFEGRRRVSLGASRARNLSSSASPGTSYSSFSQASGTSPASQYAHVASVSMAATYSSSAIDSATGHTTEGAEAERQHPMGIPISSSSGQNVYQMMTLETTSGTVQLPVDVQAASRVADEKRRRNAGASARFRQRRKEKEKEASSTIARLEQQLKDLGQEVEFYARERDLLTGILRTIPGGERHLPRPTSPRTRRSVGLAMVGPSEDGRQTYASGQARSPRERDTSRNVRRRTSNYSFPPPAPPAPRHQPQSQPLVSGPPFVPHGSALLQQSPSASLPSPMTRPSLPAYIALPPPAPTQAASQQLPPASLQSHHQSGPWNSHASEHRMSDPPSGPPPSGGR